MGTDEKTQDIADTKDARALAVWQCLMDWGGKMGCHQMPERSFFYRDYQFPICARCTGVLPSTFAAAILFFYYRISITTSISLSAVMLLDWLLQFWHIRESTNVRRLITGFIGGFGVCTLHMYVYYFIYKGILYLLD